MLHPKKKLALPDSFELNPIIKGLEKKFDVIYGLPAECGKLLYQNRVDIALIPPIEYAKHSFMEDYRILPEVCLSSFKEAGNSILVLSPTSKEQIYSVAFKPGVISEVILTKILFMENYDIELKFLASVEDVPQMLTKADAAVLIGNDALKNLSKYKSKLFLAEEWYDLTQLPFVSGLWTLKENRLNREEVKFFNKTIQENVKSLLSQEQEPSEEDIENYDSSGHHLFYGCNYSLGESETDALDKFFEYAFFYGMIEDIPDLRFLD